MLVSWRWTFFVWQWVSVVALNWMWVDVNVEYISRKCSFFISFSINIHLELLYTDLSSNRPKFIRQEMWDSRDHYLFDWTIPFHFLLPQTEEPEEKCHYSSIHTNCLSIEIILHHFFAKKLSNWEHNWLMTGVYRWIIADTHIVVVIIQFS